METQVRPTQWLNNLTEHEAKEALRRCCGASNWVTKLVQQRPFEHSEDLKKKAAAVWETMAEKDWLEAFSHHPKIGADLAALKAKFATTTNWAEGEQSGVKEACEETLVCLRDKNAEYESKFGFIFIVCATGKSADEMLALLLERIENDREKELTIAAGEQAKITQLRLERLCQQ